VVIAEHPSNGMEIILLDFNILNEWLLNYITDDSQQMKKT